MREEQLVAYLKHRMPDAEDIAVTAVARIAGGASRETWSFDARWRERGADVHQLFIVRRDPPASLLESNNDLEFAIYRALEGSNVPAPRVRWIERDGQWLDRPFFVMERLPGASDARTLATSPEWADMRETITRQKAAVLAAIHRVDPAAVPSLDRPASPEACAEHEIARWKRTMRQDAMEPQPVLELGFNWLKRHLPQPPERLTIVHADYRTGNFLYDRSGITGILDWEMAHAGDPMEDLGWVCIRSWRWAGDERVGGLCDREEFFRMYEEAGGATVDREAVRFWEVFGNVKLAIIFITATKAILSGKTPDLLLAVTSFINPGIEAEIMELIA